MRLRSFCHRHTGYESSVPFRFQPCLFRAAHVSGTCIFSRANRCTWAAHVCATIPRARLHLLCTYRLHVCPHVRYVRMVRIRVGLSHSRLAERYTGENKQSCHQPPFRLGILSPNPGIYLATILLLCNGAAMAKTAAERQAAYRKNRATAGDNGERRINVWVSTATALALQRLARRGAAR